MKIINIIIIEFFIVFNLYGNEDLASIEDINNFDMLKKETILFQEDSEKKLFIHENKIKKTKSDFIKTKKLKDLKIKSIYTIKGIDYVILQFVDETKIKQNELNSNIEEKYIEGDFLLGHKIIDIDTNTKSLKLYKYLDEEYGYVIYLSNNKILVSDLVKTEKSKKQTKVIDELNKEKVLGCLYRIKKENLNVRNSMEENATILRVLKINDQITIKRKNKDWVEIETIYKKISGDVMDVSKQSNWIKFSEDTVISNSKNCK